MGSFTITINDIHDSRVVAAINGFFPNWQTEHPTFTIKQMVEYLVKKNYLVKMVDDWGQHEIQQAADAQKSNLTEIG